jgi:hypothetical protein
MCFRFDGENALTACWPETCRERLYAASARAPLPAVSRREPGRPTTFSLKPDDAEHGHRLAVAPVPMY